MNNIIAQLLQSQNPFIRLKALVHCLDRSPRSPEVIAAKDAASKSTFVDELLKNQDANGRIPRLAHRKWSGAHWTLYALAELDLPPGDKRLYPLRDQDYDFIFSPESPSHVVRFGDRTAAHACYIGSALFYSVKLGLVNEQTRTLIDWLLEGQWPDGGWNCDRKKGARKSSLISTFPVIRGLQLVYDMSPDKGIKDSIERALEVFLTRKLFLCLSTGEPIAPDLLRLHYPWYGFYDILLGLKMMVETGHIDDVRCNEALDILMAKRLPDGGFPCEARFHKRVTGVDGHRTSTVGYGPMSKTQYNEFVTIEALAVLKAAGRL